MLGLIAALVTETPTATAPALEVDANLVTPGVIGFAVTALLIVATILLAVDMTRRMRRVRYRAEARERIAAELDARVAGTDPPDAPNASDPRSRED